MNGNIVIWGAGWAAEKLLFRLNGNQDVTGKIRVEYVIDTYKKGKWHEMSIYKFHDAPKIKEKFIVVAVPESTYLSIKEILESEGFREFDDFIYSDIFLKKLCVINANCHGNALKEYLNDNASFGKEYGIYPVPMIHLNDKKEISEEILKRTDLYIHQNIKRDNSQGYKLSDEYTLPRLKAGCRRICIPNFVKMAVPFYPTHEAEAVYRSTLDLYYKDTLIDEAYMNSETKNLENMIQYILNYQFSKAAIHNDFSLMIEKLKEREKSWDIKIVDYIMDNYMDKQMFVDVSHPSDDLMLKICCEVCKQLGFSDNKKVYHFNLGVEAFIWPQVKEILGIRWDKNRVREYTDRQNLHHFGIGGIDMRQYIQEYIWCAFGKYIPS